jgi:integrase
MTTYELQPFAVWALAKNTRMRAGEGVTLQRSDFTVVARMYWSCEKLEKET